LTLRSLGTFPAAGPTRTEGVIIAIHLADAAAVALGRRNVLDAAADALVTLVIVAKVVEEGLAVALLHGHVVVDAGLGANLGQTRTSRTKVGVEWVKGIAENGRVREQNARSRVDIHVVGDQGPAIRVLSDVDLRIMIRTEHVALGFGGHRILGR
jgi:hypothetical protein